MFHNKTFWFIVALIVAFIIIWATGSWAESYRTLILSDGSRDWDKIDKFIERLKPDVDLIVMERRRINFHPGFLKACDTQGARELTYALRGEEYDLAIVFTSWQMQDWFKVAVINYNWFGASHKGAKIIVIKFLSRYMLLHELSHIYADRDYPDGVR